MTLERSHGKLRLARTRLRDTPAAADRERRSERDELGRFAPGNGAGRNRTAKRSLTATLRAVVAQGAGSALVDGASPQAGAQIAQHALTLYRAGARDLQSDSAIALSHLVRWAANTAIAAHLSAAAADAGPETERGLRLLDRAHACEGRAERASIAALTMARALGNTPGGTARAPWLEPDNGDGGAS